MRTKFLVFLAPLLAACAVEGVDTTSDDADRGGLGKADLVGKCELPNGKSFCGGHGAGNCWCDEACVDFGDCCADAADACGIDAPPPEGDACGGLAGLSCGDGEFCNFAPEAQCGAADQLGTCETQPEVCIELFAPVCGCDGETYPNSCFAAAAGTSVVHEGECEPAPGQFCGGIAGIACPEGQTCVDNPDDGCDPALGGADCGGMCIPDPEPEPGQFCGGIANIQCPEGQICVDDPTDACDPALGGADCGGVCVPEPEPEACKVAGCSSEMCVPLDGPDFSVCIFQPWYVCLELTECGNFGEDGACGWEPNDAYLECLAGFGQ